MLCQIDERYAEMSMDFSTKESQVTDKSIKLRDFSSVLELVKSRVLPLDKLNPIIEVIDGWIKKGDLNLFDKMMSYFILGHCYNTKRCLTLDPGRANYNDSLIWREVFCYRTTLRLTSEVGKRKLIALYLTAINTRYQALVHLGSVYDHFGRFQEAQNLWLQAGHLRNDDYMWRFNIGFSLGSTHGYYERRAESFVLAHAQSLLKQYVNKPETTRSATALYERIKDFKTPDISEDKVAEYEDTEEGRYNQWVNDNWLRLNSYNDINPHSLISQDDSLYFNAVFSPKQDPEFGYRIFSLLNEIKQEYVSARFMLYQYFTNSGTIHFSDKSVRLSDNADYSNYSYHIEVAKSSFRALYSLLDKIAYALNEYLGLGVSGMNVSFKDIWYSNKKKRTLRKEITNQETAHSLAGLLFIRNDIYGGDECYLQDEKTLRLKAVRNAMEHRAIIVTDDGAFDDSGVTLKISRTDFEETAMTLIHTVRQAIFCFVNTVNHIEYDKKMSIKKADQLVIPQPVSTMEDKDKV